MHFSIVLLSLFKIGCYASNNPFKNTNNPVRKRVSQFLNAKKPFNCMLEFLFNTEVSKSEPEKRESNFRFIYEAHKYLTEKIKEGYSKDIKEKCQDRIFLKYKNNIELYLKLTDSTDNKFGLLFTILNCLIFSVGFNIFYLLMVNLRFRYKHG